VIILPEVQSLRNLLKRCFWAGGSFFLLLPVCSQAKQEEPNKSFQDCNWLVSYRGKTYDLAPLTREALARPIDTDLRFALRKVPASADHLDVMSNKIRDAKAHTILGSIFATGFLVAKILEANQTNADRRAELKQISFFSAAFFLGATYQGYRATSAADSELESALEEFNKKSPHKINPGRAESEELEP